MKEGGILTDLLMDFVSIGVMAASTTVNFLVSETISSNCLIAATDVPFGSVNPVLGGKATASGVITSTCTKTTPYTIKIRSNFEALGDIMFH